MDENCAAYAAGRELIRVVCKRRTQSMKWKISLCGSFEKQITWVSISCIVTFPDRTYKLLNYATWYRMLEIRFAKNVRCDFVESLKETENFKSFLLDVNDAARHAQCPRLSQGKIPLSERNFYSRLAEKRENPQISSGLTLTIFTRKIEPEQQWISSRILNR